MNKQLELVCSFCSKLEAAVERIVAGPGSHICNECIQLCVEILDEEPRVESPSGIDREASTGSTEQDDPESLPIDRALAQLAAMFRTVRMMEPHIARYAIALRNRGVDTAKFASALDVDEAEVLVRFRNWDKSG